MTDRWVLNRAGILNVYQYDDEVLHFGGGRLLLRGVNGSGKSTAMNMLLPFLLDADTRRIDAAGVQSGVLRSWMLTGRDEPQPVGYLWIEVARGDEYLVFGCGIRANRSTDTVATWWFVTDRRPHVDVNLLDGRTPRSIDSLRETLGVGSTVFTKDQRGAYRAELRARLFGGADLDQHIRLLHVLRNPTVGDRVDSELEGYLDEALPQLSEHAIDDAAQPLEDLEEHRRNVTQLTATDDAMRALAATYADYARGELRAAAERASTDVDGVAEVRRRHDRLQREAARTKTALADARESVRALDDDITRLTSEIAAVKDQPLYQEGKGLEDLRAHVRTLAEAIGGAEKRVADAMGRLEGCRLQVERDATDVHDDRAAAITELSDLAAALALHDVDAGVGDLPAITLDEAGTAPMAVGAAAAGGLGEVMLAIARRRADVDTVRAHIRALERAVHELDHRMASVARARHELSESETDLAASTAAAAVAVVDFRTALERWTGAARTVAAAIGDDAAAPPVLADDADVRGERVELRDRSATWVRALQRRADGAAARADEAVRVAAAAEVEARESLEELLDRSEPDPPSMPWQVAGDEPRLAALVDFGEGVAHQDRLGLEAALEASGLLAATIHRGGIKLSSGDLVAIGGPPADRPLSDLLDVTLPESGADHVDVEGLRTALDAISVDFDGDAATAVAVDGRFRIGSLAGRHRRDRLELVGVTARRARLERLRDEARSALRDAEGRHEAARVDAARWSGLRTGVAALTDELPSTAPLDRALLVEESALRLVEARTEALRRVEDEATQAERERDDREDVLRREAASLRLPQADPELRTVDMDLTRAGGQVDRARGLLVTLDRSLVAWAASCERLAAATAEVHGAEAALRGAVADHEPQATRLATLEDSLGLDYQLLLDTLRTLETGLVGAKRDLPVARGLEVERVEADAEARAAAATAAEDAGRAETAVVRHLDSLRAVLVVPGLVLAAWPPEGRADEGLPAPPAVERSSAGVRELAGWILAVTPVAEVVNAESVRMSLRQRRNSLGNGWDAEDRQPDPALPLAVEVNGPEGRFPLAEAARVVSDRLHQQRSLLDAKQTQALRNLLQGLVAKEIAAKLGAARDLVALMNRRLGPVETAHGIRVTLEWRRRDDLDAQAGTMIDLLARPPDLRTAEDDELLIEHISRRIDDARSEQPEAPYRDLIAEVLDYRRWHHMRIMLHRPGQSPQRLGRRTALSEGEKKVVSYLPLFAAVAASCDAVAEHEPSAPRFVLLDDAFAKVSVDNHDKLFGLLVEMDLDFIATSERLWGTHASVPELAITEVIRDAEAGVILLEHARWNGTAVEARPDD